MQIFDLLFKLELLNSEKMVFIMFVWNQLVNLKLESYQSRAKEHQGYKKIFVAVIMDLKNQTSHEKFKFNS